MPIHSNIHSAVTKHTTDTVLEMSTQTELNFSVAPRCSLNILVEALYTAAATLLVPDNRASGAQVAAGGNLRVMLTRLHAFGCFGVDMPGLLGDDLREAVTAKEDVSDAIANRVLVALYPYLPESCRDDYEALAPFARLKATAAAVPLVVDTEFTGLDILLQYGVALATLKDTDTAVRDTWDAFTEFLNALLPGVSAGTDLLCLLVPMCAYEMANSESAATIRELDEELYNLSNNGE